MGLPDSSRSGLDAPASPISTPQAGESRHPYSTLRDWRSGGGRLSYEAHSEVPRKAGQELDRLLARPEGALGVRPDEVLVLAVLVTTERDRIYATENQRTGCGNCDRTAREHRLVRLAELDAALDWLSHSCGTA